MTVPTRILIINPNTSLSMTTALHPVIDSLSLPSTQYTYFTCPSSPSSPGIPSINSPTDATKSAEICLPHLLPLLEGHDAFLVACYSQHPLVGMLKRECKKLTRSGVEGRKYVTGIFEASVLASLALLDLDAVSHSHVAASEEGGEGVNPAFGIVSTGAVWESALKDAVESFLGTPTGPKSRFIGCETTGLNASELHDLDAETVRRKMMEATKRLLLRGKTSRTVTENSDAQSTRIVSRVQAICLGCAGMVGLDSAVREACIQTLGEERGNEVHIVDGVKAGVGMLYGLARAGF